MFKRYCATFCAVLLLLLVGCESKNSSPAEQPDGTFLWNGLELLREERPINDWGLLHGDVSVPENVLTAKDRTITLSFKSRGGEYEYGFGEFIQVYLDGAWYSSTKELSQNEKPLVLGYGGRDETGTTHTVDLSALGGLPPGRYRFVETFYDARLKEEICAFANFWVVEPGKKRPPESEISGKARKEDILLSVQSLYEARREITDMDIWFCMHIENLSGKQYIIEQDEVVLEVKQKGKWETVGLRHVNAGLISGWRTDRHEVFLNEPLAAGRYRIRFPIHVFDMPRASHAGRPGVEIIGEFEVLAHENAAKPKWEISRLSPSPFDEANQSPGISMSLKNPVVNKKNTELEITISADKFYTFGEHYMTEVLLKGTWYQIPFASGGFTDIGYSIGYEGHASANYPCRPVLACGVLPEGQYRIIKEFTLREYSPEGWGEAIANEFAIVEFAAEETIGSEQHHIERMAG